MFESETTTVRDPVCGMSFEAEDAIASSQYEGAMYYFCSPECRDEFEEFPEDYAEEDWGAYGPAEE